MLNSKPMPYVYFKQNKTSYKAWTNEKPDISHFKVSNGSIKSNETMPEMLFATKQDSLQKGTAKKRESTMGKFLPQLLNTKRSECY